jgi:hypothetical protein
MSSTCTAHMVVVTEKFSGAVTVSFCRFHVGHSSDLGHLSLSHDVRLEIAAQLQQGVTIGKILDVLRDNVGTTLTRDHLVDRLVSRKDIKSGFLIL